MSKFFKTTWFKCVSFLLILSVVLGGLLAILNDVLYVDDSERTARAVKKIYGEAVDFTVVTEDVITFDGLGTINKIYKVGETDTLFQTTGANGYKGGTITLWIKVVEKDGGSKEIEKIVLESYDKQTLMSKFDGSYADKFITDLDSVGEDDFFVPNTGATYSAKAYNNAVKCVSEYFKGGNK